MTFEQMLSRRCFSLDKVLGILLASAHAGSEGWEKGANFCSREPGGRKKSVIRNRTDLLDLSRTNQRAGAMRSNGPARPFQKRHLRLSPGSQIPRGARSCLKIRLKPFTTPGKNPQSIGATKGYRRNHPNAF